MVQDLMGYKKKKKKCVRSLGSMEKREMNGARGRRELVKRIGKKTEHDGVQQHAIKSSYSYGK